MNRFEDDSSPNIDAMFEADETLLADQVALLQELTKHQLEGVIVPAVWAREITAYDQSGTRNFKLTLQRKVMSEYREGMLRQPIFGPDRSAATGLSLSRYNRDDLTDYSALSIIVDDDGSFVVEFDDMDNADMRVEDVDQSAGFSLEVLTMAVLQRFTEHANRIPYDELLPLIELSGSVISALRYNIPKDELYSSDKKAKLFDRLTTELTGQPPFAEVKQLLWREKEGEILIITKVPPGCSNCGEIYELDDLPPIEEVLMKRIVGGRDTIKTISIYSDKPPQAVNTLAPDTSDAAHAAWETIAGPAAHDDLAVALEMLQDENLREYKLVD